MQVKSLLRYLFWIPCFFLLSLFAEEPTSSEDTVLEDRLAKWNLMEIENFATNNNPLYLSEKQNIGLARGDVISSALYYNPQVNIHRQFMGARADSSVGLPETYFQFQQPLDLNGTIPQRTRVANQEFQASIARFSDFDRLFRLRLRQNYWAFLYITELINFQKEFLENYEDLLELNRLRASKGDISPLEYERLELERVQIDREYKNSRIQRAQIIRQLRVLIGIPQSTTPLRIDGKMEFLSTVDLGLNLENYNIENRPDLQALVNELQRDKSFLELKKKERIPALTLGGEFVNKGPEAYAGVYASIPLPVFNRNQGEIFKAEESTRKSAFKVEAKRLEIEAEIVAALRELRFRESQLDDYKKMKLIDKNKTVQEKSRLAYLRGAVPLIFFLEAERNYLSVLRSYYELLYLYYLSLENFRAAVGKMTPTGD